MNIFGIVRSAANLIIARYANDDLRQPNLTDKGNIAVEQILAGPIGLVPAIADTDDGSLASGQTAPLVISENYIFSFATNVWTRENGLADGADGVISTGLILPLSMPRPQIFNGVTWDRIRSALDNADGQAALALGTQAVVSRPQGWNGAAFDRQRVASAAVQASFAAHIGIAAIAMAGNWSIQNDPAVNIQATITRAGSTGFRHICTSITATLAAGATAGAAVKVYLRDGVSGVGAILWSGALTAPIGGSNDLIITGLSIVGNTGAAMTLEFAAAGGLTTFENVSLTGYTVN